MARNKNKTKTKQNYFFFCRQKMMDTKKLVQKDTNNKDTKLSDVTMNSELKSAGKNVLFNLNVSAEKCFFAANTEKCRLTHTCAHKLDLKFKTPSIRV